MRLFTLFPDLLFLSIFAIALMRLVVAGMFGYSAWKNTSRPGMLSRAFGVAETAVAAAMFVGAWTQAFGALAVILLLISLYKPGLRSWPRSTVALLIVMSLVLTVMGAGAFAFDLPL